ncbi:MAG: FecR domain-containing protein [Chitinophagaceae bacterium]|nr:FecR domain-containing protein [Chitinophagaceae bacterium]
MKSYWDKFAGFTEEEFAADEYFQQWVLMPDNENEKFWQTYLENHPLQRIAVINARKLVEHLADTGFHVPNLTNIEKQALKEHIFKRLYLSGDTDTGTKKIHSSKWLWMIAASVTGILMMIFYFVQTPNNSEAPLLAIQKTAAKQIKEVLLPDNSIVILNGNSSIAYSNHFNESPVREVFLKGNAYFKIQKKEDLKPFVVHANQININVTGTEFNVDARTQATDVVLTSGSVNVTLAKDSMHKTHLNPGEKLMLDTIKQQLITEKTDTQLYTAAWKEGEWHFEETTLETVASLIEQFYGMEVVFESRKSKKLQITAVVSVKDFSTLVHVIEKTLNIQTRETPNQLFIN